VSYYASKESVFNKELEAHKHYGDGIMPSFSQTSHQWPRSPIQVYFVALITQNSLQQSKSDLPENIAMSSGTSKSFLQAYTS